MYRCGTCSFYHSYLFFRRFVLRANSPCRCIESWRDFDTCLTKQENNSGIIPGQNRILRESALNDSDEDPGPRGRHQRQKKPLIYSLKFMREEERLGDSFIFSLWPIAQPIVSANCISWLFGPKSVDASEDGTKTTFCFFKTHDYRCIV